MYLALKFSHGSMTSSKYLCPYSKLNLLKIEELGSGAVYCQILDAVHPGKISLTKVNWKAKVDYEFLNNYKILQSGFDKFNIKRYIDVKNFICRSKNFPKRGTKTTYNLYNGSKGIMKLTPPTKLILIKLSKEEEMLKLTSVLLKKQLFPKTSMLEVKSSPKTELDPNKNDQKLEIQHKKIVPEDLPAQIFTKKLFLRKKGNSWHNNPVNS